MKSLANVKTFSERNKAILGIIGTVVVAAFLYAAVNTENLPGLKGKTYSAYFEEAGGLFNGAFVQISGVPVGKVKEIELQGPGALVSFNVRGKVRLGERTTAAIKTKGLLGTKNLDVIPAGDGQLSGPIPIERTVSPYQLTDALSDLTAKVSGLDTKQLSDTLATVAETFSSTPPELHQAVQGLGRFSQTVDERDAALRRLLDNANKASTVLARRVDNVLSLVKDSNALLAQLSTQAAALDQLSNNISALSAQLKGFIAENRTQLKAAAEKLNGVLAVVDHRKERLMEWINRYGTYIVSLGEVLGSGPFFKAYLPNLIVGGQTFQPFIDAAFQQLGLDPNTLLPSQLTEPEVGQKGTPPLPPNYPRTGQAGPPPLGIPDAITGFPDPCNPPDYVYRPAKPCYYPQLPLRDRAPAPAPGATEYGPPELAPPGHQYIPSPGHVYVPAPGETPHLGGQR
jgi:phospholipid/cholesterol/gamma-HCH transport system substrate-binding protein